MFADSVCVACAASPRPDSRRPTHSLPVGRRREAAVRLLSVERLHHGIWSLSRRCVPPPQQNARATASQIYRPSTNCWKTPTINCLINSVITPPQHSLHYLLPPPNLASQHYNLRLTSSHNRQLPTRSGYLADANFITRLLYKQWRI